MNILVCLKQILDPEVPARDFAIDASGLQADASCANQVTNIFCENALETALQLKDLNGGKVAGRVESRARAVNQKVLDFEWDLSEAENAFLRELYDADVHRMDRALGTLLDGVEARGLLENTWVIYTSDHGEMLGDHHRRRSWRLALGQTAESRIAS